MSVVCIVKQMDEYNELKCVVSKRDDGLYDLHVTSGFFDIKHTVDYLDEDEIYDTLMTDFRKHLFKMYHFKVYNAEKVSECLTDLDEFAFEISELDLE